MAKKTQTQLLRERLKRDKEVTKYVTKLGIKLQKQGASMTGGNVHKMKQLEKKLLTPKQKAHLKYLAELNRKYKKGK